ncbi:MAG TPA: gamma-glutamylcyclotransferase [Longimicrobium sp.]|nr:gamma-glutamylcyclotransferase [Longimicrobium sp.]
MMDLSLLDVHRLIAAANAERWAGDGPGRAHAFAATEAERELAARFHIHQTLAVYGTLAPGRPNHHVVSPLGGEWTEGVIEGELFPVGWGATLGYPAFRPRAGGPAVPVHVLKADALAGAWPRLDRFEGPGYRRILVPVFAAGPVDERRLYTVANLYAAADPAPGEAGVREPRVP